MAEPQAQGRQWQLNEKAEQDRLEPLVPRGGHDVEPGVGGEGEPRPRPADQPCVIGDDRVLRFASRLDQGVQPGYHVFVVSVWLHEWYFPMRGRKAEGRKAEGPKAGERKAVGMREPGRSSGDAPRSERGPVRCRSE